MAASTDAQRLIALSLGKIALSRQQRGGINLHKNLLVASVLHKARTTYMMDNFQTLLANKRSQAEREAKAKMIVETPKDNCEKTMEITSESRGVSDCNKVVKDGEVHHGERPEKNNNVDKENVTPMSENHPETVSSTCDRLVEDLKSKTKDTTQVVPVFTGKLPLSVNNSGSTNYVSQLPSCRCVGGKRRRSFVEVNESVTEPKKARFDDEVFLSDSESDSEYESDSNDSVEPMQTDSSQVKNLVDIFSGLCKENESKQSSGHINVIVSADRPISGHQYVLTDISCGTQMKDNVTIPTAIALAV